MDTINNYVEAMFMNLPETAEFLSLKEEMLFNMSDKYEELKLKGLAENEAVGTVISEFGQIDELLSECNSPNTFQEEKKLEFKTLSNETITDYIAAKKKIGFEVGLGVFLCGVAGSAMLCGVNYHNYILGIIATILVATFVIALFIMSGIRASRFNYLNKGFLLTKKAKKELEQDKKNYEKSFYVSLILGISLCVISSIPVIIGSQYPQNILMSVILTILIATIGCFFLIYSGIVNSSFSYLLKNGMDESLTKDQMKKFMSLRKLDENIWYVVLIVYFLVSFLFESWAYSWIIFLFGAFLSNILVDSKKGD